MVRPKVEFRFQRNGNSLQFFHNGVYCGSLALPLLCALAKQENVKNTILENIQVPTKEEPPEMGGLDTISDDYLNR